jgi:Na+-driven multidrug efflux pump
MAFVVLGLLTIGPVFTLLGATARTLPFIEQYMRIWYLGVGFVVIPMVGNNAIRATGDTKTPSVIMLIAVAANATMDPLLIFGLGPFPRMEIAGAALATVIARATTFLVALWVLGRRDKMLTMRFPGFKPIVDSWKKILYIGVPTAATRAILPVSIGMVTRLVSTYGIEAVAGFGVATRIEFFALTLVRALSSVLMPFVGQNWGAGKLKRVASGVAYSNRLSVIWGALMFGVLALAARPIASLFNGEPRVVDVAELYLRIVPLGYGFYGAALLVIAALNALNRPLHAAGLSAFHMFALYVPLAVAGSSIFGLTGMFGGLAASFFIAGTAGHFLVKAEIRKASV